MTFCSRSAGDAAGSGIAADMALLRGGRAAPGEGRVERVPGERRALDADGKLADAGEDGELAEALRVGLLVGRAGQEVVEAGEERLRLAGRLPLDGLRHE